jgi:hypothetical protein
MKRASTSNFPSKKENAQIFVVFALVLVGLVAIIGLAVDLGAMYGNYARLRKSVDAAALSASSQFRKGYTPADLVNSAEQFLDLNGVIGATSIVINTCADVPDDPVLCTTPLRKMVRVKVSENVPLYFLAVIGIRSVPITVSAVSEAASVDLILVIDTSESMTFDAAKYDPYNPLYNTTYDPNRDPSVCNNGGSESVCQPFRQILDASSNLTDLLFEGYDRVSIITFDQYATVRLAMSSDFDQVRTTLESLKVTEGRGICPYVYGTAPASPVDMNGPCRAYDSTSQFVAFDCAYNWPPVNDPSKCGTTNIGEGFYWAGNVLGGVYPDYIVNPPPMREDSLWVVILLTDGAANAGYAADGTPICPAYTWTFRGLCRDEDARPSIATVFNGVTIPNNLFNARHLKTNPALYDADDYARDQADFVAIDQGALIFTIGLGPLVNDPDRSRSASEQANNYPPAGETLLRYAADNGLGLYYPAPTGAELNNIFLEIGKKIAVRISR